MKAGLVAVTTAGLMAIGQMAMAATVSTTVPGTSDPWLAELPNGSSASYGDVAPDQSPVQVVGLPLLSSDFLTFSATGSVNYVPSPSGTNPDGSTPIGHATGAENGISDITVPANSLVGIFLGSDQPNLTPAPSPLDFSSAASRDFLTLAPDLKQVFFIGDGLTSASNQQKFFVPTGANRLFLGTMDGYQWSNNFGQFNVSVQELNSDTNPSVSQVPEPSEVLGILALGGIGLASRFQLRSRHQAKAHQS